MELSRFLFQPIKGERSYEMTKEQVVVVAFAITAVAVLGVVLRALLTK
jgi:hypothetical protein